MRCGKVRSLNARTKIILCITIGIGGGIGVMANWAITAFIRWIWFVGVLVLPILKSFPAPADDIISRMTRKLQTPPRQHLILGIKAPIGTEAVVIRAARTICQ